VVVCLAGRWLRTGRNARLTFETLSFYPDDRRDWRSLAYPPPSFCPERSDGGQAVRTEGREGEGRAIVLEAREHPSGISPLLEES